MSIVLCKLVSSSSLGSRRQRLVNRPSLRNFFADDRSIETIYQAYRDHGYTQREIAEHLGVHYATISRRIKKWEETQGSRSKSKMLTCKT